MFEIKQSRRLLFVLAFLISAVLAACDGNRDQTQNIFQPEPIHHEPVANRLNLNFQGDWQGTWASQDSTAKLPVASNLHRDYWSPSLHYLAADGKVAGSNFRQCYYDDNAAGYLQEVWNYPSNARDTESQWLATMGDDILIFDPFVLWSDRPLEKKGEQRYSYGYNGRQTTVEVYKASDDFLVNSRWQVEIPGYVLQGDYTACADLRWRYDRNTLRLSLYSFSAVIPFTSINGEDGEVILFFDFENAKFLEERTYDIVDDEVTPDEPGLRYKSVRVKYGPRVVQIQSVADPQLTITNIGADAVDIRVSGKLLDDTTFVVDGKMYIAPDGWLPH